MEYYIEYVLPFLHSDDTISLAMTSRAMYDSILINEHRTLDVLHRLYPSTSIYISILSCIRDNNVSLLRSLLYNCVHLSLSQWSALMERLLYRDIHLSKDMIDTIMSYDYSDYRLLYRHGYRIDDSSKCIRLHPDPSDMISSYIMSVSDPLGDPKVLDMIYSLIYYNRGDVLEKLYVYHSSILTMIVSIISEYAPIAVYDDTYNVISQWTTVARDTMLDTYEPIDMSSSDIERYMYDILHQDHVPVSLLITLPPNDTIRQLLYRNYISIIPIGLDPILYYIRYGSYDINRYMNNCTLYIASDRRALDKYVISILSYMEEYIDDVTLYTNDPVSYTIVHAYTHKIYDDMREIFTNRYMIYDDQSYIVYVD